MRPIVHVPQLMSVFLIVKMKVSVRISVVGVSV